MMRKYTHFGKHLFKKSFNNKFAVLGHRHYRTITSIKTQAYDIEVNWSDRSKPSIFNHKWLRSCCECNNCLSEHSNQKIFLTSDIPTDTFPENIEINDEKGVTKIHVRWNDGHISNYSEDLLKKYDLETAQQQFEEMYPQLWDKETLTKAGGIPFFEFNDYMNDEEKLFNIMSELNEKGFVILKNAPIKDLCVVECAKKLGNIRETMYGVHFDVISKPSSNNIAYSSRELPLHQDLCYYESPPGFQYLHCMRFDQKVGGDSLFADGFYIANQLKNEDPEAFKALSTFKTTFHKYGDDHHMIYSRTIIEKNEKDRVVGLYWSPPFEGPMKGLNSNDLEIYYRAYKKFKELTLRPENIIHYRMNVGDLVIFNNRRILHARTSYDENEGIRHLQGTYTETETFLSRFRVLIRKYSNGKIPKLSGNHSY